MENAPPSNPLQTEPLPASSLTSRVFNVFAAPGDVFDEVRTQEPSTGNWLVPVLLACLKMTRQQADQALEMSEKFTGPIVMKIFGSVGAVIANFAMLFFGGLIVWLLGKWVFKARFTYLKAVEVVALAGMINVLGGIVATLLAVAMGNMAMTPGPVLLVHEFNPANKLHVFLSQLNLFMLWYVAVMALGLARLSGASFAKAASWLYGIWAVFVAVAVLPGWGR